MSLIGNTTLRLDIDVVEQSNCKYLSILDCSQYITKPENASLDITIPGFSNPIRCSFDYGEVNVYNSGLLGITGADSTLLNLPDGIYTITYRICPLDVLYITKKIIRVCELECKYLTLYAKVALDCSSTPSEFDKLNKIKVYIESAKAHGSICNYLKAAEFIQKANSLLLEIDCKC